MISCPRKRSVPTVVCHIERCPNFNQFMKPEWILNLCRVMNNITSMLVALCVNVKLFSQCQHCEECCLITPAHAFPQEKLVLKSQIETFRNKSHHGSYIV